MLQIYTVLIQPLYPNSKFPNLQIVSSMSNWWTNVSPKCPNKMFWRVSYTSWRLSNKFQCPTRHTTILQVPVLLRKNVTHFIHPSSHKTYLSVSKFRRVKSAYYTNNRNPHRAKKNKNSVGQYMHSSTVPISTKGNLDFVGPTALSPK